MKQVMLLIDGKWVATTWQLYNRYKHENQMGNIKAAMVLKTVAPFETRLNEPIYFTNGQISPLGRGYVTTIGGKPVKLKRSCIK